MDIGSEVMYFARGMPSQLLRITSRIVCLSILANAGVGTRTWAHEGTGRAGLREKSAGVEVEAEFYTARGGYLHGGLGLLAPLNDTQKIGIVSHFVREETGGEFFPSLGVEFIQDLGKGIELEATGFAYFPVENQHAWSLGFRGSRHIEFSDHVSITPFLGPAFARAQTLDEETGEPANINHLMLLGGVSLTTGPVEFTLFGSHSFFSRDPTGLETHVDLEEMTHFAAYENNDGFARNTVGTEVSYSLTEWLTLTGRYALILYEDETRHSFSFTPAVKLNSRLEVFAGVQLLRGNANANLLVTGAAFSF